MTAGCMRALPGSHRWGAFAHDDKPGPLNMIRRGQGIGGIVLGRLGLVDIALERSQALLQVGLFLFSGLLLPGPLGDRLRLHRCTQQQTASHRRQQAKDSPRRARQKGGARRWNALSGKGRRLCGGRLAGATQFYFDFP